MILSDMLQHEESIRMSVSTTYQAEEVLIMLWKDAIISHTFVLVMRLEVFDLQKSEASPTLSRVISTSDGQEHFSVRIFWNLRISSSLQNLVKESLYPRFCI